MDSLWLLDNVLDWVSKNALKDPKINLEDHTDRCLNSSETFVLWQLEGNTSLSRLYDAYINDDYLIAFCLLNNPKAKSTVATGKEKHEPEQPNHFIKYRSNKKLNLN